MDNLTARIECHCKACNGRAAYIAPTALAIVNSRSAKDARTAVHNYVDNAYGPMARVFARSVRPVTTR